MRISDWSSDVCSSDLFEQRSAWQRAWAEYNTGQSAIDYVRTAGTGADTLLLNPGQIGRRGRVWWRVILDQRSEEHTSELQSLMRISYAVFCLKKKHLYTIKVLDTTTYIMTSRK